MLKRMKERLNIAVQVIEDTSLHDFRDPAKQGVRAVIADKMLVHLLENWCDVGFLPFIRNLAGVHRSIKHDRQRLSKSGGTFPKDPEGYVIRRTGGTYANLLENTEYLVS